MDVLRTLLVDDDLDAAHQLALELGAQLGPTVVVPDAYQALSRLADESFDVVILEIALPGANGIQLLERLMSGVSAVVLTWLLSPPIRSRALAAGAHAVLAKPCPTSSLVAAVRAARPTRTSSALVTA